MEIRSLQHTALSDIVQCLVDAFEGYFVKIPSDVEYWRKRYYGARVDMNLSFGMFDQDKLIGFIIIGIDVVNGKKIAFNTGTGVIEAYRGQQMVDKLYQHALPIYKKENIDICALEVIQTNHKAVRVYERCGFKIDKSLRCFKGKLTLPNDEIIIQKASFEDIFKINTAFQSNYSWDFVNTALLLNKSLYQGYFVKLNDKTIGYFIINPASGMLAQFELLNEHTDWKSIFTGIAKVCNNIKINNVNNERTELIQALTNLGLDNFIDQYDMVRMV